MGITDTIEVIDADCHLLEPYDLWTSRMATKWGDRIPHVVWSDEHGQEIWLAGDRIVGLGAWAGHAGGSTYYPDFAKRWEDVATAATDPAVRLELMDDYGIYAELLYGNVLPLEKPGLGLEIDEDFLLKHPPIEGPGYI